MANLMPGEWNWLPSIPGLGQDTTPPINPTDDATAQILLKRRLAQADALRNQQMPQGQMVSGHYVAPSWTQYLAGAVGQYKGKQEEQQAMQDYSQAQATKAQKLGDLMKGKTQFVTDEQGNQRETTVPYSKEELVGELSKIDSSYAPKLFENYLSNVYKEEQPVKLGANESIGRMVAGKYVPTYTNTVDKPEALTNLAKLQKERAAITDPNDIRAKQLDEAIFKETHFAPSPNMTVNMPRVETSARINANEDFTKNVYRPTLDQAKRNTNTLAQLDVLDKLPISSETGWSKEAQAKAANVLVGLGYTGTQAKELASNAQTFNAIRGKQTWEMLGAQKGPQTEGDAQRAQATYAQLGNTPEANKFINAFQRAVIKRQQAEAKFYNQHYNEALSAGDLSQLERDWLNTPQAQMSIFDMPEMKQFANMTSTSGNASKKMRWNPATNKLEPYNG